MHSQKRNTYLIIILSFLLSFSECKKSQDHWKPNTDWGHWRLGHRSDIGFLKKNRFTVTFGSGAPSFEYVSRDEFNQKMDEAKTFNKAYHDSGYIVLRYLSTSLNGTSASNNDIPEKEQIHLLKFYNESWDDFQDYIGAKPQEDPTTWITVRPDGTFPFYRYAPYGKETGPGFETWGCPNNPHYIRMMEGRIRAQAETGIDGSYVDWTQIAGGTCYCKYCKAKFTKYLTENLPADIANTKYHVSDYADITLPEQRGDPFWMEWIQFRGYTVAEFHKRLRTVARKYNPHFMISGNIFGGFGYGPIAYDAAGNIEMLGQDGYDDFIYSEIQEFLDSAPRKDKQGTKITNSPALKFLTAASHGKPVIIYATEITPPIFPDPTEKCLSAMAQINIAEAVANHAIFREKRETPPGATEIYQFLADNENSLVGAHLYSNVAVVSSLNQYLAGEISFAFSTSRILADQGIAHVMLIENDLLNADLNKFDLVVLPYLPLLSIPKQQSLITYVEQGGTLIIAGTCGEKDQYNVPREKILLAHLFAAEKYPEKLSVTNVNNGTAVFLPFEVHENRYLIPMKTKGEYTTFGPTMADMFPDIPEGYTRNRIIPELRNKLETIPRLIIERSNDQVTRLLGNYPYVEITTMLNEQQNKMLVHLVNYDVTIDGSVTLAENIAVQIRVPEGRAIKSIQYSGTLSSMQDIEHDMSDSQQLIHFNLNQLNTYGLAIINFE